MIQLPEGCKVHYRYGTTKMTPGGRPITDSNGNLVEHRFTIAYIKDSKDTLIAFGRAVCNEELDQFCKATGRIKSLGRAIGQLDRA